jgi:hypothetical protein
LNSHFLFLESAGRGGKPADAITCLSAGLSPQSANIPTQCGEFIIYDQAGQPMSSIHFRLDQADDFGMSV